MSTDPKHFSEPRLMTDAWKNKHPETRITQFLRMYSQNVPLYEYASKFWDGQMTAWSLSRAIRFARNTEEAKKDIDPFETLVDAGLYLRAEDCGQEWDEGRQAYISVPCFKNK
jgi:hypothetical protein